MYGTANIKSIQKQCEVQKFLKLIVFSPNNLEQKSDYLELMTSCLLLCIQTSVHGHFPGLPFLEVKNS